jgi:hypothetical protein
MITRPCVILWLAYGLCGQTALEEKSGFLRGMGVGLPVATGRAVCQVTGVQGLWQFCLDRGQPRVSHVYLWLKPKQPQTASCKKASYLCSLPVTKLQDPR